ncbi:MAG: WD40/YVTN/BNR-like repeat-containing protein [Armatimonadota bacterium]
MAGESLFVAAGHDGLRIVSRDGIRWEHAQSGREGETFLSVCFGGGRCVAAGRFGGSNLLSVTADGRTWKNQLQDARYALYLLGLCHAAGRFLGVGGDPGAVGASQPFVVHSPDGESWSERQEISGKNVLRRLAWGSGRIVAVGDRGRRAVSTDGLTWQDVPEPKAVDTLVDVAFGAGVFVGVGLHGLRMVSRDGLQWEHRVTGPEGEHLNSVLWTGKQFAAIGLGASYFSADGVQWERRPNRNPPLTAAYGAGTFVGAAWKGRLLRSPDGVTWEEAFRAPTHVEAVGYGALGG